MEYAVMPPVTLYTFLNPFVTSKVAAFIERIPPLQKQIVCFLLSSSCPASTLGAHCSALPRGKLMISAPLIEATASSLGSLTSMIWYDCGCGSDY